MATTTKMTKAQREEIARIGRLDDDKLFREFYDALPKSSDRFAKLGAAIRAACAAALQE